MLEFVIYIIHKFSVTMSTNSCKSQNVTNKKKNAESISIDGSDTYEYQAREAHQRKLERNIKITTNMKSVTKTFS